MITGAANRLKLLDIQPAFLTALFPSQQMSVTLTELDKVCMQLVVLQLGYPFERGNISCQGDVVSFRICYV